MYPRHLRCLASTLSLVGVVCITSRTPSTVVTAFIQQPCHYSMYSSSFVNHEARRDEVRKHKRACTTIQHHSVSLLLAQPNNNDDNRPNEPLASKARRALLASSAAALTYNAIILGPTLGLFTPPGYKRISPIQFIAALGDRDASSGNGADSWGLWSTDPGPRGLRLRDYEKIKSSTSSSGGETVRAPPWLNEKDFFLDENAIIMPQPEFPLPAGKYLVTGGRMVTTGLTIEPSGQWKLDSGKLYDVTHLPCRAARYRPNSEGGSPLTVQKSDFPVVPGAVMPKVPGTDKQDYAVLFIVGKQTKA